MIRDFVKYHENVTNRGFPISCSFDLSALIGHDDDCTQVYACASVICQHVFFYACSNKLSMQTRSYLHSTCGYY